MNEQTSRNDRIPFDPKARRDGFTRQEVTDALARHRGSPEGCDVESDWQAGRYDANFGGFLT